MPPQKTRLTIQDTQEFLVNSGVGGEIAGLEPLAMGASRSTYKIRMEDGRAWVASIEESDSRDNSAEKLRDYATYLYDKGVKVARPVGQMSTVGGKPCHLAEFIEGVHVNPLQPCHLQQLGEALAELHTVSERYDTGKAIEQGVGNASKLTPRKVGKIAQAMLGHLTGYGMAGAMTYSTALRNMLQARHKVRAARLPETIIHGDLHPGNLLFKDDELAALLDFEAAGRGPAVIDLARVIAECAFRRDVIDGQPVCAYHPELAQAFLQAYHRIRPLTRAELEAIPDFITLYQERNETIVNGLAGARLNFLSGSVVDATTKKHFSVRRAEILRACKEEMSPQALLPEGWPDIRLEGNQGRLEVSHTIGD